jgi:predicted nucleic acid-binding protein
VALVAEYEHAVKNLDPSLRPSDASTDAIIDYLCAAAIRVAHIYFLWRPYLRDPKDDHVLELAVAASADAVVTYNKRDFKGIERFGIAVFNPYEYLVRLERTI